MTIADGGLSGGQPGIAFASLVHQGNAMKRSLVLCLLSLATALPAASALATSSPAGIQGVTPVQVKADLYRAWLHGTTSADEENSYRPRLPIVRKYRHRAAVTYSAIRAHRNFRR